jgi:hypothetical protein
MRRSVAILSMCAFLGVSGCAGFDDTSVKRSGTGAAVGAASGAIIGAMTGSPGTGAAVGAVVGGTGGYLYDQISKDQGRK